MKPAPMDHDSRGKVVSQRASHQSRRNLPGAGPVEGRHLFGALGESGNLAREVWLTSPAWSEATLGTYDSHFERKVGRLSGDSAASRVICYPLEGLLTGSGRWGSIGERVNCPCKWSRGAYNPRFPHVSGVEFRGDTGWRGVYCAAGVAQLAEHDVANVVVVGSNPITRSSFHLLNRRRTGMTASDHPDSDDTLAPPEDAAEEDLRHEVDEEAGDELDEGEEEAEPLEIEVSIDKRSACERHLTVSISRADIDRYLDKEFSELVTSAEVPGFRPGRTPRKVVEARFRKDVTERVKSSLVMDSMGQINEQHELSPISEPDLKLDAVEIPDEGPMTFEFDLEVRPEFDLPRWKGLKIERPVREFTEEDVDRALERGLASHGQLVPFDGPAESGDYITTNLTFSHQGVILSSGNEEVIRIRPVLSFRDGKIEKFDKLMAGVRAGETREHTADLTQDAPNQALRGATVTATFEVLEVKRLELPELTPQFLESIGDFESEADLRDAIRDNLQRQMEYSQHRRAREQVAAALTAAADWDLPPALLERQSQRELERAVLELRRSGFSDEEVRAYENDLRQNSRESTDRALKEHFILERIAEEEEITDDPEDYETEIKLIAEQSDQTPRRVRARLEKSGGMDVLRNQIVERKVIEQILSHAKFTDVPHQPEATDAEAVEWAAGGGEPESDIPEATPEGPEREQGGESEAWRLRGAPPQT